MSTAPHHRFTVSILTYTAVRQAKACIASVLKSTQPFKLILTANGNVDAANFFADVAKENPNVTVVVNDKNLGFIEPNKHALELCDTEFFIMLNDDTIVPHDWLEKLAAPFDRFPSAALSGPRGDFQSLLPSFHGIKGQQFEYLNGACLCCKTEIVKRHGLFDPNLKWAYGDDSDLSLRMRERGYTLHHADFVLQHEISATSKHVPEVRPNAEANHVYLRKRWAHYLRVRKFDYPLILKRTAAHGDVLLLTPIIRALHEKYPCAQILVETMCPQVLVGNKHVKQALPRFKRTFDECRINLDGAYESRPGRHIVLAYAEQCGLSAIDDRTELTPSPVDDRRAEKLMPNGDWAAVHVGPSTWRSKEWPHDRFEAVVRFLRQSGYRVVLVGHTGKPIENDLDQRGATTVLEMGALIKRSKIFLGLDSLPMHVSQAVGTPTVGLFGVTDPKFILTSGSQAIGVCGTTESFGLRHRSPNTTSVDDGGAAMNSISVDMVIAAIESLLPKKISV